MELAEVTDVLFVPVTLLFGIFLSVNLPITP